MKRTIWIFIVFMILASSVSSCTFGGCMQDIRSRFSKEPTTIQSDFPTSDESSTDNSFSTVLEIPIHSPFVYLNGEKTSLDTPPAFITDAEITMIPLKFISDVLGAKVEWYPNTKEISILQRDGEIQLQINSPNAYVNGVLYSLSTPPLIHQEYSFVPLAFIAEHLQFEVEWIPETKTVILRK
ncbi:MAG: copper amine oxidase N-terminal domain-containing protein [Caldisericia bacterium]|nr:copper amine oxidase N-terminal domain-containing protein [Caldisericia bacterium]MDD4615035.1 copper amine oxidase N-terminal domain-containing protein [Caldisericia bacterium]